MMKTKHLIFAFVALTAFASCGGGSSTSVSKESLFGDIPEVYEKRQVEMAEKLKELSKSGDKKDDASLEKAIGLLAEMQAAMEEVKKEAQPLADKMVGKTIAYTLSDSLPYQIVSDIKVEKVRLPELGVLNGGEKQTRLSVKFDAVVTGQTDGRLYLYYLLMDDDASLGYDRESVGKCAQGDTIHAEITVEAPDVPAKYQMSCNMLKFVTQSVYDNESKAIKERQKQWNDEMKKKLGLEEE